MSTSNSPPQSTVTGPVAAKTRQEYLEACQTMAAASVALHEAQAQYARAFEEYLRAWGAAKQIGVV